MPVQNNNPGSITYRLDRLNPGTTYNIRVTASTRAGEGPPATVTNMTAFGAVDRFCTVLVILEIREYLIISCNIVHYAARANMTHPMDQQQELFHPASL